MAKIANFILPTNTTLNRLNAYIVIKLSKLKLRHPKTKKKPNSKTIPHSTSEPIPFEAFKMYLFEKKIKGVHC